MGRYLNKTILLVGLNSVPAYAQDSQLNFALGSFYVRDSGTPMGQIEYVFDAEWSGFKPHVGLFFSSDSAGYLYGGVGHISNLDLGDKNPGAETAYLSYSIKL